MGKVVSEFDDVKSEKNGPRREQNADDAKLGADSGHPQAPGERL